MLGSHHCMTKCPCCNIFGSGLSPLDDLGRPHSLCTSLCFFQACVACTWTLQPASRGVEASTHTSWAALAALACFSIHEASSIPYTLCMLVKRSTYSVNLDQPRLCFVRGSASGLQHPCTDIPICLFKADCDACSILQTALTPDSCLEAKGSLQSKTSQPMQHPESSINFRPNNMETKARICRAMCQSTSI